MRALEGLENRATVLHLGEDISPHLSSRSGSPSLWAFPIHSQWVSKGNSLWFDEVDSSQLDLVSYLLVAEVCRPLLDGARSPVYVAPQLGAPRIVALPGVAAPGAVTLGRPRSLQRLSEPADNPTRHHGMRGIPEACDASNDHNFLAFSSVISGLSPSRAVCIHSSYAGWCASLAASQ